GETARRSLVGGDRPVDPTVERAHQPYPESHPAGAAADTPLEDGGHAEPAADLARVDRGPAEGGCSAAGDHLQVVDMRQVVDDALGEPVAEGVVARVAREVLEREHGDRPDG